MKKKHSRIGLLTSLGIHGSIFATILVAINAPKHYVSEQATNISMEMLAARLEEPQVAVAPDPIEEEVQEPEITKEPDPEPESDAITDPTLVPKAEKPKEKPKDKPKEKPKEAPKPKEKPKKKEAPKEKPKAKPIKALERGPEAKQGIVAKANPNAFQGTKVQAGVANGSPQGKGMTGSAKGSIHGNAAQGNGQGSGGNPGEVNAYLASLKIALQRRATNSYPAREKMMRKTGTVVLKFSVSPSGQVLNVTVAKSSGNSNLDAAAVKAAQNTKVNSSPPAGFPSQISAPVKFMITE